jgi:hypothetical protein
LREASGRLHTAVDARLAEGASGEPVAGEAAAVTLAIAETRPRTARQRHRRRPGVLTAATAAVLLVVGVVAGALMWRASDDDAGVVEAGPAGLLAVPHDYVVAGWLPEGYQLLGASLTGPRPEPGGDRDDRGLRRSGVPDPWTGRRLEVSRGKLGPPLFNRSDLRPITVGGHPATIAGVDAGSPDDVAVARIEVAWGEGDTATRVVGIHMSPADVLSAAEHVGEGPRITAAGLPDGFEELGRGPLSYRGNARGKDELGGLTLTYRLRSMPDRLDEDGNVPADAMTQIQITQRPGTADEFPMMQLGNPEVVETEALGEPAYSSLGTLELFDPGSQQIVTISGTRGPHGAELERVAEGLRPVALAEVEQLIAPFVLSGPPPLAAGETLLAQGTEDGACGACSPSAGRRTRSSPRPRWAGPRCASPPTAPAATSTSTWAKGPPGAPACGSSSARSEAMPSA